MIHRKAQNPCQISQLLKCRYIALYSSGNITNMGKMHTLRIKNNVFFLSEDYEIANSISAGCTGRFIQHWHAKWQLLRRAEQNFLSYTAEQRILHPIEIARGVRKTEGNYSGYLRNSTFNPVKSVQGYLVTHMFKVSITPVFQTEAFSSMYFVWTGFFWWTQEKCCAFCEFRLHLGLSSCTNLWNPSRNPGNLFWSLMYGENM